MELRNSKNDLLNDVFKVVPDYQIVSEAATKLSCAHFSYLKKMGFVWN